MLIFLFFPFFFFLFLLVSRICKSLVLSNFTFFCRSPSFSSHTPLSLSSYFHAFLSSSCTYFDCCVLIYSFPLTLRFATVHSGHFLFHFISCSYSFILCACNLSSCIHDMLQSTNIRFSFILLLHQRSMLFISACFVFPCIIWCCVSYFLFLFFLLFFFLFVVSWFVVCPFPSPISVVVFLLSASCINFDSRVLCPCTSHTLNNTHITITYSPSLFPTIHLFSIHICCCCCMIAFSLIHLHAFRIQNSNILQLELRIQTRFIARDRSQLACCTRVRKSGQIKNIIVTLCGKMRTKSLFCFMEKRNDRMRERREASLHTMSWMKHSQHMQGRDKAREREMEDILRMMSKINEWHINGNMREHKEQDRRHKTEEWSH